ncbi:MAG: hypothetical protein ACK502_09180 [Alphaproteobacteria bacterium]
MQSKISYANTLTRKRGRPKIDKPMLDSGTAELVMKRLSGETTEALDLCLKRELISKKQHWCGVHLRWLYTLRFGAPGVRAIDTAHLGGTELKLHDNIWLSAREEEYQTALAHLSRSGNTSLVMNICIFNERPVFLKKPASLLTSKNSAATLKQFRDGLGILEKLWC